MRNDSNLIKEIIAFKNVRKVYEPVSEQALRGVNFSVAEGEFVCIVGPSGCGKSTVLKIIAGLERKTSGEVVKPDNVALVFQSGALFPWLTVAENVALGLVARKYSSENIERESMKYISMVGLSDFAVKYPRELSGGQRQRVGIARALAVNPSVLLLDEPFAALDPKTADELHNDIVNIWKKTGKTIVMVSHLIEEAVSLADRVILMKNGMVHKIFSIRLAMPRREQGAEFSREVLEIRKEFFK